MNQPENQLSPDQQDALNSIKVSRIIIPVIIGLAVIVWYMLRQFDYEVLNTISWNSYLVTMFFMALLCYVARHLFYAWRLRVISNKEFSWLKSIELIFIWEFASSVSPTSLGGSAVAFFLISQEKISVARTVAMVLYSMVIDTIFFVISMPILLLILGPVVIRPGITSNADLDGYAYTFFGVTLFMMIYGAIFFYGLFINPHHIENLLLWLSKRKFLSRFRESIEQTAGDVVVAANEMRDKTWRFHLEAFAGTAGAWICRFLAINFVIMGLVDTLEWSFWDQLLMYGRGEVMYAITAFSPTPGGSGIAEIIFGGFYSNWIGPSASFLAALFWRIVSYYPYLIIGALIIPNWVRKIVKRRNEENQKHI